jgi:hypothetical protein
MRPPRIPPFRGAKHVVPRPLSLLIDEMIDWYVWWGEAALAAADAYARWSVAPAGQKTAPFADYVLALGEEERTATAYSEAAAAANTYAKAYVTTRG